MAAAVIAIDTEIGTKIDTTAAAARPGEWLPLGIAQPAHPPLPFGILLADHTDDSLTFRLRDAASVEDLLPDELSEQERDIFSGLPGDLEAKGRELGGRAVLASLEESASHFFRAGDRTVVSFSGSARALVDRLFREHVLGEEPRAQVIPFVTHLPLYGLRAAATKFGDLMEGGQSGWVEAPGRLRLTDNMFVAQVVGRSMEPRIPDGSLCVFRAGVTGSRQGRLVLVEKLDETELGSRFTVKRYARYEPRPGSPEGESAERTAKIRLEPLNPDFEGFDLEPSDPDGSRFRVLAEFIEVLPS